MNASSDRGEKRERPVEAAGAVKMWKTKKRFPTFSQAPWKTRRRKKQKRGGEFPTAPTRPYY